MRKIALYALFTLFATGSALAQVDESAIKNINFFDTSPAETRGGGTTWSGTTVGGFVYDRAIGCGPDISGLGPVQGSIQPFTVGTTGAYNANSVQDGWDGYLHIYEGEFLPADPVANCIAADDDGNGGIGTSDIEGVELSSGVQYFAVTSGFAAGDEGTFTNTIDGAGPVSIGVPAPAVPVPSASLLSILILSLLILVMGGGALRLRVF